MAELDIPDDVASMTDDELTDELDALVDHEQAGVLTDDQELRLEHCRRELLRRISVGGKWADYEGGPDDA